MKKICFTLILFLSACSSQISKNALKNELIFNNEMKFEEFKVKVKEYAEQSLYPNIDN